MLGVSQRTVTNFIARGELAATRIGRQWRVDPDEFDRFLASQPRLRPPGDGGAGPSESDPPRHEPPPPGGWLTVTQAAERLMAEDVLDGLDMARAKTLVSTAATRGRLDSNGEKGRGRRIDPR